MDLLVTHDHDRLGRDRLTLVGAIDLASREAFLERGRKVFRDGAPLLTIDLAGVTFVDSSGLGSLIELSREAEDHGATIVLVSPTARVRTLLAITGLSNEWPTESRD